MNFHKNNPEPTQIIQLLNSPDGQKKNSSLQKCLSPRPKNSKFAWIMQYYNTPDGQISYFKIEIEEGEQNKPSIASSLRSWMEIKSEGK